MSRVVLFTVLALAAANVASAQSLHPTPAAWADAERVLRAEYPTPARTILDLTPQRENAMGTTFWVRYRDGGAVGGALVAVRAGHVVAGSGPEVIAAVLRADDVFRTHAWSAADLLYLITTLGVSPPLARMPITAVEQPHVLLPNVGYGQHGATLVVYAYRDGPPEAPSSRSYYVQRAVGTIDEHGALTWAVADVVLDLRGRERLPPGAARPTLYDSCGACVARGAACDLCTSRSCRTCLEHSAVMTDPSFCLPRCR